MSLQLLGYVECVALNPWQPFAACGDNGGNVYLIDLVGIEYGPIIVTAIDHGARPLIRCPACFEQHPLESTQLGQVITCPSADCETQLKINHFVLGSPK